MAFFRWLKAALFPDKCLVCFEEGAVLCESHRLQTSLIEASASIESILDQVFAVSNYQEKTTQKLVKRLKFSRQRSAAKPMVEALFNTIDWALYKDYVLMPIPLHWGRHYQRGFNQSLILAEGLSQKTGIPVCTSLIRSKSTDQQARLGKQARIKNMQAVFKYSDVAPPPAKVMLIDDVFTTGATVNAAASTLKKAGSTVVLATTFAFQPETET